MDNLRKELGQLGEGNKMICIETARLFLRNYKETDFEDIKKYFANEEVSKYEDFYLMSGEEVENIMWIKEQY